ncbi:uncharacterized protein BDV14DRAFT_190324 [Aspergillus stella-maris]|uniref:uncharacterized protein n=1 Tax=Aspergillus stella-maris TaxID=1810926 RepID=UPI003CCD3FB1
MEPLSCTASVIAIIQLTGSIATICGGYIKEVKDAREDITSLQQGITSLLEIVKKLEELVQSQDGRELSTSQILINDTASCMSVLTLLREKINPENTRKSTKAMRKFGLQALKWPLKRAKLERTLQDLERYKSSFTLVLQVDQTSKRIEQKIDLEALPTADGAEFNSYTNQHESECLPGTRIELCREILEWAVSLQGKCIFWLNGLAGTGKSTVSRTMARKFQQKGLLGASFFFKRGEGDRGNATKLFSTITGQLLDRNPELQPANQESKLDATYLPVLDRLINGYTGNRQKQLIQDVQEVIGTIILLESPLSVASLSDLLEISTTSINARLNSLHSVLDIPNNKKLPVRLFHLSFRDFLLQSDTGGKCGIWVDERGIHQLITTKCLSTMCRYLKKNMCNLKSHGTERRDIDPKFIQECLPSAVQYSCRYWIYHLARSKDPTSHINNVLAFLEKHFLHWVEAMSLLGYTSEVLEGISNLQSAIQDYKEFKISGFLHDAQRLVLKNSQIADIAPLQLYASGIIFAPEVAVIRRNFKRELPDWLSRGPKVEEDWSPELQTLEGHSKSIHSTIKLWDPATGALRHTLETRGAVWDIKFYKRFPQLVTNVGSFNIRVWLESFTSCLLETENTVSLQADRWVAINGQRELWLPSDSYPFSSAIYNTTIALGCRNGRVCVITFTT